MVLGKFPPSQFPPVSYPHYHLAQSPPSEFPPGQIPQPSTLTLTQVVIHRRAIYQGGIWAGGNSPGGIWWVNFLDTIKYSRVLKKICEKICIVLKVWMSSFLNIRSSHSEESCKKCLLKINILQDSLKNIHDAFFWCIL